MKCYVCSTEDGVVRDAVGSCRSCYVALCVEHYGDAAGVTQGGMRYTCDHHVASADEVATAQAALGYSSESRSATAA